MYARFSAEYPDVVAAHNANNPAVGTLEHYYANLNQQSNPRDSYGVSQSENRVSLSL
jgi:hypothetical protein